MAAIKNKGIVDNGQATSQHGAEGHRQIFHTGNAGQRPQVMELVTKKRWRGPAKAWVVGPKKTSWAWWGEIPCAAVAGRSNQFLGGVGYGRTVLIYRMIAGTEGVS